MKSSLLIISCIFLAKLTLAQSTIKNIDYQYYRDDKTYYAYQIYRNQTSSENVLCIDFSINKAFKRVEKVYLIQEGKEQKLKIKANNKMAGSDNPEVRFYALIITSTDFLAEHVNCNTTIKFKLDDGTIFSLPFDKCLIEQSLKKD